MGKTYHGRLGGISTAIGHIRDEHAWVLFGLNARGGQPILGDLEGWHPVGPTFRQEGEADKMERRNGVRFGVGSIEMVGVD